MLMHSLHQNEVLKEERAANGAVRILSIAMIDIATHTLRLRPRENKVRDVDQ
jgi:hypothetical protein